MGLEEALPDNVNVSEPSGSDEPDENTITIGSGEAKRTFTEERWDEIRTVLSDEMGLIINEFKHQTPAHKQKELIHEAISWDEKDEDEKNEQRSSTRCIVCGNACDNHYVEIEGKVVCTHHTTAQLAKEL